MDPIEPKPILSGPMRPVGPVETKEAPTQPPAASLQGDQVTLGATGEPAVTRQTLAEAAKSGQGKEAAKRRLEQAHKIAEGIQSDLNRNEALEAIAKGEAALGDSLGALSTAQQISSPEQKDKAHVWVAGILAKKKDRINPLMALLAAEKVVSPIWRDLAFKHVGLAQVEQNDFDGALETFLRVKNVEERESAIAEMASKQSDSGDYQGALKTASHMNETGFDYIQTIRKIYADWASSGDFAGALDHAKTIPDDFMRHAVYGNIAPVQAKLGEASQAIKTANLIVDDSQRDSAVSDIAKQLAQLGDEPGALRANGRISNEIKQDKSLKEIAVALSTSAMYHLETNEN